MANLKKVLLCIALLWQTVVSADVVKVYAPTDWGIPFLASYRAPFGDRPCLNGDGRGTVAPLGAFDYFCYLPVASREQLERFNLWPDAENGRNSIVEGTYTNPPDPSYFYPVHSSRKGLSYNPTPKFEGLAIVVRLAGDRSDERFASACGNGKEMSDQCFALFLNQLRSLPLDGLEVNGILRLKGPGCTENCPDGRYGGGTGGVPGSGTGG